MSAQNYTLQTKVDVIKYAELNNNSEASKKFGCSRRTVITWVQNKDKILREYEATKNNENVRDLVSLDEAMGAVLQYQKKYLMSLDELDGLTQRKKVMGATVEKLLWDVLDMIDKNPLHDTKPEVLVKMAKDLNEIREKIAGDPSVIIEYRHKFQDNVMTVLNRIAPNIVDEFISEMELLEESDFEEV